MTAKARRSPATPTPGRISNERLFNPVLIRPRFYVPTDFGVEALRDGLSNLDMKIVEMLRKLRRNQSPADLALFMSGSDGNYLSGKIQGLVFGKTAYTGETTWFAGLWTSTLDDTATGGTTGEAAYTSYARMSLTNNTTNFGAGTGTTTVTNTWPSDALHSWATSTGGSATVTFMSVLNGNAGTTADKCGLWASVSSQAIASGDTPQLAQNAVSQVRD